MKHVLRQSAATAGVTVLLVLGGIATPAGACACGGAAPPDGAEVTVDHEVAIVRWDGTREEIVMRLAMTGDTGDTGLVVPTPVAGDGHPRRRVESSTLSSASSNR